ncbi:MAG TPA: nitronate monooxygenase [Vicinamibacteria bacterium]|nr:nitronate monooxygenase [Vicinamibacteria bacterium]
MPRLSFWRRREFLQTGAAATAALAVGRGSVLAAETSPRFRTSLCDLLGIEYPILQSGMGGVAGPALAAAVSRAGGLGILGCAHLAPDEVRRRIREVKTLTDRPFGVNLLLHTDMLPPADMSRVPESVVQAVQKTLNRFRERLGLAPSFARPEGLPDIVPRALEVVLEEKVPVFSIGLGRPSADLVRRFHQNGAKVIAMVATLDDARAVADSGVDALVAQGHEAGGHRSTWVKRPSPQHADVGTMALVPQVVQALKTPVIAAGGIASGAGVVAALALGAKGALLGTRFVATRESLAADFYKQALVGRDGDSTVITDAFTGLYARVLRNTFADEYGASGAPVLPGYVQNRAAGDIFRAAHARKDAEHYAMWAGQSVGLVHDLPEAAAVVRAVVDEARAVLRALAADVTVA